MFIYLLLIFDHHVYLFQFVKRLEYELELIFTHIFGISDTDTDFSYGCIMNNICNQGSKAKTAADSLLKFEVDLVKVSIGQN